MRVKIRDTLFIDIFIIFMILPSIPVLHNEFGKYAKLVLPIGMLIIFYKMFVVQNLIKAKYGWLLCMYILFQCISAVINYKYNLYENMSNIIYTSIPILLVYSDFATESESVRWTKFKNIAWFFVSITASLGVIALGMFTVGYVKESGDLRIGYHLGRLYGLYRSPNGGGIYAVTSIVLSFVLIQKFYLKNSICKFVLWCNIWIEGLYISLTDSKGTYVCIAVSIFSFFFLKTFFLKHKNIIEAFLKGLLAVFSLILIFKSLQFILGYLPSVFDICFPNDVMAEAASSPAISNAGEAMKIYRVETVRQYEYQLGTGRGDIWRTGIEIILRNPIWGVGKANLFDLARTLDLQRVNPSIVSGMHNVYLQIAVTNGIPCLAFFLMFITRSAGNVLRKINSICLRKDKMILVIIGSYLAGMVINNLFEATIAAMQSGVLIIFWLLIGLANQKEGCV